MPSHRVHDLIDKHRFGRTFSNLHKIMDTPIFSDQYKNHEPSGKILHDPTLAFMVGYILYGINGGFSALIHASLDMVVNKQIIKDEKAKYRRTVSSMDLIRMGEIKV